MAYYNPYLGNYQQSYIPQYNMPYRQQTGLLGKTVENVEQAKMQDIPLDGSTSYFPTIDGSMIITKQLQMDGTSKIRTYTQVNAQENTQVSEQVDFKKELQEIKDKLNELAESVKKEVVINEPIRQD